MASTLGPGQFLVSRSSLVSPKGRFELRFQDDCNLVLYDHDYAPNPKVLFQTHTNGFAPGKFILQTDGNLVVYDQFDNPKWNSFALGAPPKPPVLAVLQDDGNFVLYSMTATFDTNSNGALNPIPAPPGVDSLSISKLVEAANIITATIDLLGGL